MTKPLHDEHDPRRLAAAVPRHRRYRNDASRDETTDGNEQIPDQQLPVADPGHQVPIDRNDLPPRGRH